MIITHINYSDLKGGAARAAYRLHLSLLSIGLKSEMRVIEKISSDSSIKGGEPVSSKTIFRRLQRRIANWLFNKFKTDNSVFHSSGWPSSGLGSELNSTKTDVIHLHWLGKNTISIEEIGRLERPTVWTLHDMWAFCGAEHYTQVNNESRFLEGYNLKNTPSKEQNYDLNRKVWLRKKKAWRKPIHIVCPSNWMAQCAKTSFLFRDWPIYVIPNPINTNIWRPIPKNIARAALCLPSDAKIVLLGSDSGLNDERKGTRLAFDALEILSSRKEEPDILLVIGQAEVSKELKRIKIISKFLGHLSDDISLILAYSASDVVLIPSRQDNLPNMAVEAFACGTPVVAFDVGGLKDIITHKKTGWLAQPFDTEDFAIGINWLLKDPLRLTSLFENCRKEAEERFDSKVVANQYLDIYNSVI